MSDLQHIAKSLTPWEASALIDCVKRGNTRANDGGFVDDLLSILCSKPSLDNPLIKWSPNPTSRVDGYISLYEPTDLGRQVATLAESQAQGLTQ